MRTLILFILCILSAGEARALESEVVSVDQFSAKLISAIDSIGEEAAFEAALSIQLKEGWHTYWRNPGDSGLAPTFDWSESENIALAEPSWPVPKRFDEYGVQTFGYSGDVTFPLHVELSEPGKPAKLALKLSILVCHDICIPQHAALSLDIPAGEDIESAARAAIDFAKTKVPSAENIPGLKIENVTAGPKGVVVNAFSQKGFMSTDIFVELKESALTSKPKITIDAQDQRRAQILVGAPENIENFFDIVKGQEITVTLSNGQQGVERLVQF